jgi:hypothetical protein
LLLLRALCKKLSAISLTVGSFVQQKHEAVGKDSLFAVKKTAAITVSLSYCGGEC